MNKETFLVQRSRIYIFFIYLILLWLVGILVTGDWIIRPGSSGMWFYAILFYLLLHQIIAPFFKTPKDVLANTSTCLIFIVSFELSREIYQSGSYIVVLYWIAVGYLIFLLVLSILAILSKDATKNFWIRIGKVCTKFCDYFGKGKIEFTFIVLLSIFGYHFSYPTHIWAISLFWIFLIIAEPLEKLWKLFSFIEKKGLSKGAVRVGRIKAYENPSLAIVVLDKNSVLKFGEALLLICEGNKAVVCLHLSKSQLQDESWCRVFLTGIKSEDLGLGNEGEVFSIPIGDLPEDLQREIKSDKMFSKKERILGFVAEGSHLSHIYFDIVNYDVDLYEGRLLEVPVVDRYVTYQITDATLRCEGLAQKNTEGFSRVRARKVGIWNSSDDKFEMVDWMPDIYNPVFVYESEEADLQEKCVGYIPGSQYGIKWDPNLGVTHNTAILGILGIGKSYLAYELIARMIKDGVKVICLDITGEYRDKLDRLLNSENSNSIERIDNILVENRDNKNDEEYKGGNHNNFRKAIQKEIDFLLRDDNPEMLRIWNPEYFDVTKQTWKGTQIIVPLTLVEVTRIIAESALSVVKEKGTSIDKPKLCMVFEEAHSLIPEWSSVSFDADKQSSNATAKAIMQGRKYGMGCLAITQRTANVIKSVLNQCNTVFAMRVFDATGMEFLKNYIGEEYTQVLTGLKDRHAVIFGRASSSNQPVIIKLNERDDFTSKFEINDFGNLEIPEFNQDSEEEDFENIENDEEFENNDLPF